MGVLDRVRGFLGRSDRLELQIKAVSAQNALLQRSLEAATVGLRGINSRNKGPNLDQNCVNITRANAWQLYQNKPLAHRGVDVMVSAIIGTGIIARPEVEGDDALTELLRKTFLRWTLNCDAEGLNDWYSMQPIRTRGLVVSGESLTRYLTRGFIPGQVPLELQVFEPDQIAEHVRADNVINGIEFSGNKRAKYHLYKSHPDARYGKGRLETVQVPAEEISHLFLQQRPGQVRGISWLAPAAIRIKELDEAIDAHLVLQKIAACFSPIIEDIGNDPVNMMDAVNGNVKTDSDFIAPDMISPGEITYLAKGKKPYFAQPPSVAGFAAFVELIQRDIASAMNVPYADISSDVNKANFSSQRAARLAFVRIIEQLQYTLIIPRMIRPDCLAWEKAGKLSGAIPKDARITWKFMPQPLGHIDPQADVQAAILKARAMGLTPKQFVEQQGYEWSEQLKEYADALSELDAAKIKVSIDPRQPYSSDTLVSGGTDPNAQQTTDTQAAA
jgi:lambda family phage portal protein